MVGVLQGAPTYLVHQKLSQGGMGAVHLGTLKSPAGERPVAIKRLLLPREADRDEHHARMIAEARLVFQLTHANICQVLDLVESDDGTFIVMELVDGCDLGSLIETVKKAGRSLAQAAAVHIVREVARALDYAHRRVDPAGRPLLLVHGDVKPANILLSREGEVKLADFGIARAFGAHAPGNRMAGGTPGYMAPEQERGEIDQRADIYALGVTLSAALGGAAAGGPELAAVIERATARRPEDRFQTIAELERALSLHLHKLPSFSPRALAEQVREVAVSHTPADQVASRAVTIFSLTGTNGPTPDEPSASPSGALRRTRRAKPRRRGRAAWMSAIGLLVGSLGLASWSLMKQSRRANEPQATAAGPHEARAATGLSPTEGPGPVRSVKPMLTDLPAPAVSPPLIVAPPGAAPPHAVAAAPRLPPASKLAAAHDRRRPVRVDPPRPSPAAANVFGYLSVDADPWGAVYVDGKRLAAQTPAYRVAVPAGRHRVTVYNPQRGQYAPARSVEVKPGESSVVGFEW